MEQYTIFLVLLAFTPLNKAVVAGPNFQGTLQLIKPPINYAPGKFCAEKKEGRDKIACRIAAQPTVGLLVCKAAIVDGEACADVINAELQNLATLRDAGVRTVKVHAQPIHSLNCPVNPAPDCSGLLEEWVGEDRGEFQHIRDAVVMKTVPVLIEAVKGFTTAGLVTTVANLETIRNYMVVGAPKYRQICDFQGFFLKTGGFLVNDVPYIRADLGLGDRCWEDPNDPEPTTQEYITALDAMIAGF